MARDILSEYGNDTPKTQADRVSRGGVTMGQKRDVMNYQPPQGPIGIMRQPGPGLGGANLGNCGTQGKGSTNGDGGAGSPGLGGDRPIRGTNRG